MDVSVTLDSISGVVNGVWVDGVGLCEWCGCFQKFTLVVDEVRVDEVVDVAVTDGVVGNLVIDVE